MLQQRQKRGIVVTGAGAGARGRIGRNSRRQEGIVKAKLQADRGRERLLDDCAWCRSGAWHDLVRPHDELGVANLELVSHFERARGDRQPVDEDRDVGVELSTTNDGGEERKRTEGPDAGEAERVSPSTRIKTSPSCGPLVARSFIVSACEQHSPRGSGEDLPALRLRHRLRTIRSDSAVVDRIGVRWRDRFAGPRLLERRYAVSHADSKQFAHAGDGQGQCRQRGIAVAQVWTASEDEERRSKAKRVSRSKEKSDARQNAARREHRLSHGAASTESPLRILLNPHPLPVLSSTGSGLPQTVPLFELTSPAGTIGWKPKKNARRFLSDGRLEFRFRSSIHRAPASSLGVQRKSQPVRLAFEKYSRQ